MCCLPVILFRFQAKLKSDQYYINFKKPPGKEARCSTCVGQCGFSVTKFWCAECHLWKDGRQINITKEMAEMKHIPDYDMIEHAVNLPRSCSQRRTIITHELLHVLGKYNRRLTSKYWAYIATFETYNYILNVPRNIYFLNNRRIRT